MNKRIRMQGKVRVILILLFVMFTTLFMTGVVSASSVPEVVVSGPLEVTRSQIVKREFMNSDSTNVKPAFDQAYAYNEWKNVEITSMFSKISINGNNIEPQDGDLLAISQLIDAMNLSGYPIFNYNPMNAVLQLSQAIRAVPGNLPLSSYNVLDAHKQEDNDYIYTIKYSLDVNNFKPLFENVFVVHDNYRQITFQFEATDGSTGHGRFIGPIDSFAGVEVPNNVVGVPLGGYMGNEGVSIPAYELDQGWNIIGFRGEDGKLISEEALKWEQINKNQTYTIVISDQPYIEAVVPAVWIPVDGNGSFLELNPKQTFPDMYERKETARPKDGRYQITYFGEPFPNTSGEEEYYNFMYTDWLYFTDAFHRVQAQGKFPDDKTAVTMIQYGQLEDYAESDSGLHGMTKTPYQPGETMLLIVEAEENINLSKATLKEGIVTISSKDNDAAALDKLKGHFESITYLDIDAETPVWKPFNLEDENSPRKLFIYKYNEDGVGGSFIEVNGEYQDFMSGEGLSALPFGKYEAVFPIYWQKNVPNKYVRADDFSRNRYKIDDTVHFTFEVLQTVSFEATKTWLNDTAPVTTLVPPSSWPAHPSADEMPDIYLQLMSKSPDEQAKPVEGERIRLEKTFEERSYHFPNLPAEDANGQRLEYSVVEQTVDENGNFKLANIDNYTTSVVQFPGEMESNIYNIYMPTLNGDRSSPCQLIWYAEAIINQRVYHHPLKLFTYSVNESHDTFTTPDGIEMQSGGRFEIQHWGNGNRAYWRIPITTRYPLKNAQLTFNFDEFSFPDYAPWKPVEGFLDNLFAPNTTEFLYRFTGGLAEGYKTLPDLDLSNVTYVNDPDTGEHSLTINLGDMPAMSAYMIQINGEYDQSESGDTGEILPSFITGVWLTADTRCLTGEKGWVGDPPPEGTSITLELVKNTDAGPEVVDTVVLTYPDNKHTWGRLDWDADYTIRERNLPDDWIQFGDAELVQESEDGSRSFWAITNVKATSVTATKTWVNGATPRPTVWFQLYRQLEGGEVEVVPGADIKELADGTTTVTWDNLAQTDKEGREYTFTVREVDQDGNDFTPENYEKSETSLTVTNTYVIPKGQVTANKAWVNGPSPRPTVWFQLYRQVEGGAAEAVPGANIKELVDGTLSVTWDELEQTDINGKVYIFSVKEVDKDGNDFTPENYNKSETGLTVTNTYVIPKGEVTANKAWVNGPSPRPSVWFQLYRQLEGGAAEAVPGAEIKELTDGTLNVTWADLEQMDINGKVYIFSVKEVDKDGNNYTPANYRKSESNLTVTNTYVIPKGQVTANKTWVNGPSPRPTVWFQLYRQLEGGAAEAVPGADIKELKDGTTTVSWNDLEQTDINGKVYTFSVKEVDKDGNDLTLFNYSKVEDGLTVTNTFVPPEKTFADLTLKKKLDGMDLASGAFSFQLFGNDLSTALETKTNDADGTVAFRLQFDVEGPFVVHVKEVNAGKDGFTYDSSVYKLTYQVVVGADNKLQATLTEVLKDGRVVDMAAPLVFNNTYTAPTPTPSPTPTPTPTPSPTPSATPSPSPTPDPTMPPAPTYPTITVPLAAKKELKNGSLKAGEFTFQLKDKAGKVLAEVTNGADGSVVFPARTFSKEVSNYLYTITELAGENSKMKYDRTVYTIKVTTRAVAGELQATVQVEKDGVPFAGDVLFTNVLPAPPTGDAILTQLSLLLGLSLALLGGAYLIRKKRQNTN